MPVTYGASRKKAVRLLGSFRAPLPFFPNTLSVGRSRLRAPGDAGRMQSSARGRSWRKGSFPSPRQRTEWYVATDLQPAASVSILPFFALFSLTRKKIRKNFAERLFPARGRRPAQANHMDTRGLRGRGGRGRKLPHHMPAPGRKTTSSLPRTPIIPGTCSGRSSRGPVAVYSLPFDLPFSIKRFHRPLTLRGPHPRRDGNLAESHMDRRAETHTRHHRQRQDLRRHHRPL